MEKIKVIFLDNDGVICLSNNWGSRANKRKKDKISLVMNDPDVEVKYRFDYFDKKAIKVLNQVLEETGAEIVVSSDWRLYANLEELGEYYLSEGIVKKPIGVMTDSTVEMLNKMVERIKKHIENLLEINRDYRYQKIDLLNFAEYFNMKYDKDAGDEVYPDVGIQFEKEPETEITKGKKGKKGTIVTKKK
jgi:hypothetical protein